MNMFTSPSPGRRKRHQSSRSLFVPVRSAVPKGPSPKQRTLQPSNGDAPESAIKMTAATKEPRRSKRVAELDDKSSRCNVGSTPLQSTIRVKDTYARKGSQPVRNDTNVSLGWQPTAQSKCRKEAERPSSRNNKKTQ